MSPDALIKEFEFLVMVYKIYEMGKKTILFFTTWQINLFERYNNLEVIDITTRAKGVVKS